jgi:UDP-4-amino-4,6-dideoxy-N-acetyl-beta-L-altrosamine transaminase
VNDQFLPYARQVIDDDDIAAVVRVLRSSHLTSGPEIPAFEAALAAAVGAPWAVAVSSGTAALHAACIAAGLGAGDEVIVPAITFVASANCARYVGAEPVFADVAADTGLVEPEAVRQRVTGRTRAIVAVHLGGATADLPALGSIAAGANAILIEDAAHALGASRDGVRVGSGGDGSAMATFSFHPVKHIATGEGGAVTGVDPALRDRLRLARDHGIVRETDGFTAPAPGPWYYEQQQLGHNLRLTELQAALGRSQLAKLERFLARRRALAARYSASLTHIEGVVPVVPAVTGEGCAYHLFAVRIDFARRGVSRAEVIRRLRAQGIGTQVHYIPVPSQPYYRARGWSMDGFPGARAYYEQTLSLPMFAGMDDEDVDRVTAALDAALRR